MLRAWVILISFCAMASAAVAQDKPQDAPLDAPAVAEALAGLERSFAALDWLVFVFDVTERDGAIHLESVQFTTPDYLSNLTLNDALLEDVRVEGDVLSIGKLTAGTLYLSFDEIPLAFNGREGEVQTRSWQFSDLAATEVTLRIPPLPGFLTSEGQLPAGTGPHSALSDSYAPFPAALTYAFVGGITAGEITARQATFEAEFAGGRGRHLIDDLRVVDLQSDKIGLIEAARWRTNAPLLPRGLIQHDVHMRDVTINP